MDGFYHNIMNFLLGIFAGAFMMLGLVAMFQFYTTKDDCLSSLYGSAHDMAEGFFTIQHAQQ